MAEALYWEPNTDETPEEKYERKVREYLTANGVTDPEKQDEHVKKFMSDRFGYLIQEAEQASEPG
jgi:hypothetical protein